MWPSWLMRCVYVSYHPTGIRQDILSAWNFFCLKALVFIVLLPHTLSRPWYSYIGPTNGFPIDKTRKSKLQRVDSVCRSLSPSMRHHREQYVASIDQGTSSSRCIIFDRQGTIVSSSNLEHTQLYPEPGSVEHDAEQIWVRFNLSGLVYVQDDFSK